MRTGLAAIADVAAIARIAVATHRVANLFMACVSLVEVWG